jgi:hypothetical protein
MASTDDATALDSEENIDEPITSGAPNERAQVRG